MKQFGTYRPEDVTILLKDITGLVEPLGTKEREAKIQSGVHYSEMLPLEYEPSEKYLSEYYGALAHFSKRTAQAVAAVSEKIIADKGKDTVLVSLARAGVPIGILIKHYIKRKYNIDVAHYAISIIRGRGIDHNAMKYILERHDASGIQFVDGWTGKGAIKRQLDEAMKDYPEAGSDLAVLSDPGYVSDKCGTHDDFIIASSCLNSTVSGLLSRTFYRTDIIGPDDFHGAVFYKELLEKDLSYPFIDAIEKHFTEDLLKTEEHSAGKDAAEDTAVCRKGLDEVEEISRHYGISDINFVKPGIGETTRVLLRRVPWKVLVNTLEDEEYLGHIYQLAREKGVEVEVYPLQNYRTCGIIKNLADT